MTQTKKRTVVARTTSAARVDSSYPSLTEEALGQLKLSRRLSNEADDWTKGGRISTSSTAGRSGPTWPSSSTT
jgi:hypothetical protein